MEPKENGGSRSTTRSPRYPAFPLEEAIERAREFYEHEHFGFAPAEVAISHWGYSPKSSTGTRCLAALLYFDLLESRGRGDDRRVGLTETGKDILLDGRPGSEQKTKALQKAALSPTIFQELWDEWDGRLPSEASMEFELERERGFNADSVGDFIDTFRATLEFAGLLSSGVSSDDEDDKPGDAPEDIFTQLFGSFDRFPPSSPKAEDRPMAAQPQAQVADEKARQPLDYPVAGKDGAPIAALRVTMPLDKEEFEYLEMELDHRLNVLAKMLGITRSKRSTTDA